MVLSAVRLRILLSLLPVLLVSSTLLHAETDFEISEEVEFRVEKKDSGYSLSSEHKEYYRYLTKRSTGLTVFPVYEHFYTEVSDLSGRAQGGKISRDMI